MIGLSPVNAASRSTAATHHRHTTPAAITRKVFGARWRTAWCISYAESRHTLNARNGDNLGPWQINVYWHPWANPYKLTHSWRYGARAAYRISGGGRDWSAWPTHALCGV